MRSLRIIMFLAGKQIRLLLRMRAVLAVIFLPGIVMYTVFTLIFPGAAGRPFRVAVVDQDQTAESRQLIDVLARHNLVVIRTEDETPSGRPLTTETARRLIRKAGKFRVAVVIPPGFGQAPYSISGNRHEGVVLLYDETQPMEAEAVAGLLQMSAGRAFLNKFENIFTALRPASDNIPASQANTDTRTLIKIHRQGVAIDRAQIASKHAFLAGIIPLFLLFSCVGAARGLLEELTGGGIIRLLAAPITPAHILLGQQLYAWVLAMTQCAVMYFYAWLVFDVTLGNILGGLFVLTVATCLASTGFGMLMASLCRTGEQLDAIGTTVVLAMSAIGGSMVPRFVMPAYMYAPGLFTINGWSYDGFIALIRNEGFGLSDLFERGEVSGIWLPCVVLVLSAAAFSATGSLLLARRLRAGPGA